MENSLARPSTRAEAAPLQTGEPSAITPEVVRLVTERVYLLLLADLRIEQERRRRRIGPLLFTEKRTRWR